MHCLFCCCALTKVTRKLICAIDSTRPLVWESGACTCQLFKFLTCMQTWTRWDTQLHEKFKLLPSSDYALHINRVTVLLCSLKICETFVYVNENILLSGMIFCSQELEDEWMDGWIERQYIFLQMYVNNDIAVCMLYFMFERDEPQPKKYYLFMTMVQ